MKEVIFERPRQVVIWINERRRAYEIFCDRIVYDCRECEAFFSGQTVYFFARFESIVIDMQDMELLNGAVANKPQIPEVTHGDDI